MAVKKLVEGAIGPLAAKAPDIIHELNPFTWFTQVISELHAYKNEKLRIEKQFLLDSQKLKNELEELRLKKEAYVESLNTQRNLINTVYKPDIQSLKTIRTNINEYHKKLDMICQQIVTSGFQLEDKKLLLELYKITTEKIDKALTSQEAILAKNKENLVSMLNALNSKNNISIES